MSKKYYSQFGEDKWVWEHLLGSVDQRSTAEDVAPRQQRPTTRTFCEVGAFDGVTFSNTKAFEEEGWKGICVEANPTLAGCCQRNRGCMTWCCAVGDRISGFGTLFVNQDYPDLSGLDVNGRGVPSPVIVKRLDWLLERSGIRELDLLSIDTEGTELEVYETLGQCRARVIIMEHLTGPGPSRAAEMVERLGRDGYEVVHDTACNLVFVRRGLTRISRMDTNLEQGGVNEEGRKE